MAVGLSAAFANAGLSVLRGTTQAGVTPYAQLHTGDPGAAGTTNVSATTTRQLVAFAAPAGGVMALSALPSWSITAGETVTHLSLWDASTGGTFLASVALTASRVVQAGDTLQLTALSVTRSPLAG